MRNLSLAIVIAFASTSAACSSSSSGGATGDGGSTDGTTQDSSSGGDVTLDTNLPETAPADMGAPDGRPPPADAGRDVVTRDGPPPPPDAGGDASCGAPGAACMMNSDCCSNNCKGNGHCA